MAQILYKDIIKNKEINEFIKKGDANLATLGYTEHSKTHCTLVAERAAYLLEKFGHADAEIELAKIAGYMHDIGNAVIVNIMPSMAHSLQMISCGGWICRLQIVQPSFLRLGITTSQPEVPWILCQRR